MKVIGLDERLKEALHYHIKPKLNPFMLPFAKKQKKKQHLCENMCITPLYRESRDLWGCPSQSEFAYIFLTLMSFTLCTWRDEVTVEKIPIMLSAVSDRIMPLISPNDCPEGLGGGVAADPNDICVFHEQKQCHYVTDKQIAFIFFQGQKEK